VAIKEDPILSFGTETPINAKNVEGSSQSWEHRRLGKMSEEETSQEELEKQLESYERELARKEEEVLLSDMERVRREEDRVTPKTPPDILVPSSIRREEAREMARAVADKIEKEEGEKNE